jgi:hypothetical protein
VADRTRNPRSWSNGDGVVHSGERALRKDGACDYPWADCGKRTNDLHWTDRSVNCIACLVGGDYGPYG